ncbi:oligosaccharide flippase family protein [Methylobacterium sp. C25]|uniref:oligosaccharide flippase family protein n=1 Tax=Methylobacterium sp. C25 TaxID=2721622 RepID=UPI002277681F|nr:oligosaccharide flippase family protein [Methylobacterium sp. C25]
MNSVRRSLIFSALERYCSVVLVMIATAVLARLLTPHEFGVYAILSAQTAVASAAFQEFGGANYLIQKPILTERDVRTAFTVTLLLSLAFAAALFASRDAVATFFDNGGMRVGIAVFCLCFLLSPFAITLSALLRREMRFDVLARSNVAATVVNVGATVILALNGFSFMAPIWGVVVGNLFLIASLWLSCPRLGIFRPSFTGYREVLRFGSCSSAVVVVNVFYQAFPQFILGRLHGFDAAGLFARSMSISQLYDRLVVQILNPVIMPAMSAQSRAGGDLGRIYLSSIEMITAIQWPILLYVTLMAQPLIEIWLGATWLQTVPLVQCLCLAALSLFAACLTYPTLVAAGKVRDTLVSSLISLPPSILIVALAAPHGAQAVAASSLVTCPLQAIVAISFIAYRLNIRAPDILRHLIKSAFVAVCSVVGPLLIAGHMVAGDRGLDLVALLAAGTTAFVGWLSALFFVSHPLADQIRQFAPRVSSLWREFDFTVSRDARPENLAP